MQSLSAHGDFGMSNPEVTKDVDSDDSDKHRCGDDDRLRIIIRAKIIQF